MPVIEVQGNAMNEASDARRLIYDNIDRIMDNAQRFRAEEAVSLKDLLSEDFLAEHTTLSSIDELFSFAGENEVSETAFARIPDDRWDLLIRRHSSFGSWQEMFTAATQKLVRRRLLEGCKP